MGRRKTMGACCKVTLASDCLTKAHLPEVI